MKIVFSLLLVCLGVSCACTDPGGTRNCGDGGLAVTKGDGGFTCVKVKPHPYDAGAVAFDTYALDTHAHYVRPDGGVVRDRGWMSVAYDAPSGKIGVAYFVNVGPSVLSEPDGGSTIDSQQLRYVEFNNGSVSTPEVIATVQRTIGLSLAFQSSGQPAVAYLGGGADMSTYWFQSDAMVSYRTGNNAWTAVTAVSNGNMATCGNPVSDRQGIVEGLWPALAFDGTNAYLAYRDGHDGQFPQQDWAGSDLELAQGSGSSWSQYQCVCGGGNNKGGWGGRTQIVVVNGEPAVVFDQTLGGADAIGNNVIFSKRTGTTWSAPEAVLTISNVQTGPGFAYDSLDGYGVAALDMSQSTLNYVNSTDGADWNAPVPVFGSGSGGWYPSLAFDPIYHEPTIAFYVCSPRAGVAEGNCPTADDDLRITQRIAGNWTEVVVDTEGGYLPKVGFLTTGKRFVVYRLPSTGDIKLAVEK